MTDGPSSFGPSFGLGVLVPTSLVLLVIMGVAALRMRSPAARFVIVALWARYIFGAFHVYMFRPLFAGLSGNALGSVLFVGLGLLVIRRAHLLLAVLMPVYLLIGLSLFSATINHDTGGAIDAIVKYVYFAVILIATFEAAREDEEEQFMPLLIWAFMPLLLFQWLSLALNLPKGSETGDGLVWIGGFDHEATFSVALSTAFIVACLAWRMQPLLRVGFLAVTFIGIFLAGYRTTILAMGPLALAAFFAALTQFVKKDQRGPVAAVVIVLGLAGAATIAVSYGAHFSDLGTFLSDPSSLIKPPRDFTQMDRQIMSGRALIWSEYLYAYKAGAPYQHLFGFGPDSWVKAFDVYPHNTLISTLYELGGIGMGAMLLLWIVMTGLSLRARPHEKVPLIAAHLSFVLLNFATMPFWQVEGLALYGVLCGYSLFSARARVRDAVDAGEPAFAGEDGPRYAFSRSRARANASLRVVARRKPA